MVFLGIDGGGSQTRALLCDASGRILGRGLSGPSNPRSTPAAEWGKHLLDVIRAACGEIAPSDIRAAHLGIAGAGEAAVHERLTEVARELLCSESTQITVSHDLATALEGGLAGEPGIVLVAGTGSASFGRNADGLVAEAGGWGDLVDDAGSGSWLGLRALQACARQADGRLPQSALSGKVLAYLGLESMVGFKTRIHDHGLSRRDRAQLAPVVLDLATSGDAVAGAIVAEAVGELQAMAASVARQLGLIHPDIVVCGGLSGHAYFNAALTGALQTAGMSVGQARMPAVAGALLLAIKSARITTNENTFSRLSDTSH